MPVGHHLSNIASVKPTVADHIPGRLFVLPVAGEHPGAAHNDLAVGPKPHLLWIKRNAGIAGLLERLALAEHECVLGDAIEIAQIDAPDLPERLDRVWNRRAGRERGRDL